MAVIALFPTRTVWGATQVKTMLWLGLGLYSYIVHNIIELNISKIIPVNFSNSFDVTILH